MIQWENGHNTGLLHSALVVNAHGLVPVHMAVSFGADITDSHG